MTESPVDTLINRHFPRSRGMALAPTTMLKEDLFGNDIDILSLAFDIEGISGCEIPDDDITALKSVADVRALAAKHMSTE